jgi:alpha,alpha-trehalase
MRRPLLRFRKLASLRYCLLLWIALVTTAVAQQQAPKSASSLKPILEYISLGWNHLTRQMTDCSSIVDPKLKVPPVLYLPAGFSVPPAVVRLQHDCKLDVEHLPKVIHQLGEIDTATIRHHGLLYLPNKYVVPGGRFNEMYGWDTYFIILGLLRDGRTDLARGMVENFFFEIEHYGALLNANRTYYLTRSQPPFLSSMVLAVYEAEKQAGHNDTRWLERAYPYLEKDYSTWTRPEHLAGSTGLARYYDFGEGPPPEGAQDEAAFYRKVIAHFMVHPDEADHYLVEQPSGQASVAPGFSYSIAVCDVQLTKARPECEPQKVVRLSAEYYKGDRSMRESGFDISFRFGAYGAATHHYAPVCLNSLLYKYEKDMQQISDFLGKSSEAKIWQARAETRQKRIEKHLWDQGRGMFFDYNFASGRRSTYQYVTTFYPLWTGLATPEQAALVAKNLTVFEQPGGLVMSPVKSGAQWDYPYGWAPVELIAIQGLRRYGFNEDADRISYKFLSAVLENFRRDGTIREKYNVVTRSSETPVEVGYHQNIVGFGWTNGVFLELLQALPKNYTDRLENEAAETMH